MRRIAGIADAIEYLAPNFENLRHERVVVLLMTRDMKLKECFTLEGKGDNALMPLDRIARAIARTHARVVVLAHNHPSGVAEPSEDDLWATRRLADLCRAMGARLADHLIYAGGAVVSLRQLGHL